MKIRTLLLSALMAFAFSLPAISSDLNPASFDKSAVSASAINGTTSDDCWVYIPGFGWVYFC